MSLSESPSPGSTSLTALGYGELVECPFATLSAAFHQQVLLHPNVTAVRHLSDSPGPPGELTYAELAYHAQQLAARLRGLGLEPGQRVPLVVKRGLEMVVGIWAVLLCGAQYVPLDGGVVPDSTLRHVVEQSTSRLVLCVSETAHRLRQLLAGVGILLRVDECMSESTTKANSTDQILDVLSDSHWVDLASPDGGCYVIYTSGSS